MTTSEAINQAYRLHIKWVSSNDISMGRGFDLERIRASIRSEMNFDRQRPERSSAALKRETHGDSILLGKVSKTLTGVTLRP